MKILVVENSRCQKDMCCDEIRLCAHKTSIVLGSILNTKETSYEKGNLHFDLLLFASQLIYQYLK